MEVRIREAGLADCPGIARVHTNSWQTTYRGIVPDGFLDGLSCEKSEERFRKMFQTREGTAVTYVALVGDEIVGFASGGRERKGDPGYDGELYGIYLLSEYQRQGIGRRLVAQIVGWLKRQGLESMLVWVLAGNPACHFYESLGGRIVRHGQREIGGAVMNMVGYGWKDLQLSTKGNGEPFFG